MADFASLQQEIDQIWGYARQARDYNWMARARVILMRQEAQRAYRWALTACVAPWIPTANALTQEITATILASHGLLDTRPARPTNGRPR
jgi:hypothetical protein